MLYVFNTEGDNEILGEYLGSDEDYVIYRDGGAGDEWRKSAPSDCVTIREVSRDEMQAVLDRFKRSMDSALTWVGGDTTVAMNSLVAVASEMVEYATKMGAALAFEAALAETQRQVRDERRYSGARAHSRQFEEAETDEAFRMAQGLEA